MNLQYILASGSPMRQQILKQLGIEFDTIPSNIIETPEEGEEPEKLASRLGKEKCETIASRYPDAVVIGGDQLLTLDNTILGKPKTIENAQKQLALFSNNWVTSIANVSVTYQGTTLQKNAICRIKFKELSEKMINSYLLDPLCLECAGSLRVESNGILLIESVESDDPFSIYGMPLIATAELLEHHGLISL